ncbi:uncharacterized protein TrAtP1_002892 [Trichoderma atroviride]|uniref:uncharacterized protein n=1 Tax=Hypocrea atroviridis TaxID=63577 RepID=UPI0033273AE0|nr:hypothetical protein TrAtP1_002892 [Trichoderma atroviride]
MTDLKKNIPKGALVIVTGVTGFVGSHIAKALLERGYRVRGTVRDVEKAAWLVKSVLKDYADTGRFEFCYIPDIAATKAYDEAIQGVSAIAHVASILSMDPDPTKVIPATVAGVTSILNAAMKEPSVKSFVYTSSLGAATMLAPGNEAYVTKGTYNDFATKASLAPPPYEAGRGMLTYMASKVAAEKALWKFAEQQRPHFTISSVVPSVIIGEALNKVHNEGDGAWVRTLYDGNTVFWKSMPAIFAVDVKDVAAIHVAAILDPEVANARLHVWGHKCNANDLLTIMRKNYPHHELIDDLANQTVLSISADFSEPLALLKKWTDQNGWRPLEDSVVENVESIIKFA